MLKELTKKHFDLLDLLKTEYRRGFIAFDELQAETEKENNFFREVVTRYELLKD